MIRGAILHLDVAQITLYFFWAFFAGLVWYLRQEDRREGYPLESEIDGYPTARPWLFIPPPKAFLARDGSTILAPNLKADTRPLNAVKVEPWPGAPIAPTGDPLLAGVGPGAYAERPDVPYKTAEGHNLLAPLRVATNFAIASEGVNPIGYEVVGADRVIAGTVSDVWVDRSESFVRYYEVALNGGGSALIPINFADVERRARIVRVKALQARQFALVPQLKSPETVTMMEEERIVAFYGGGLLYATAPRGESLL